MCSLFVLRQYKISQIQCFDHFILAADEYLQMGFGLQIYLVLGS